jgi:heme/copper-type cytochrome/quinol oxidase subunit 4
MMKKTTSFGIDQLSNPTPLWAKMVFRVCLVLTTVASFWVAASTLISPEVKTELMLAFKTLDMFVFSVSKLFGIELKNEK